MSCGDTSWTWYRHYYSLCMTCGSVVEAKTQKCEYCDNKVLDNSNEDSVYYGVEDDMIKSKKRTCDRCKALWYDATANAGVCVLDHKILDIGGYEPLEACKKPKTKQELLECLRDVGKVVPV